MKGKGKCDIAARKRSSVYSNLMTVTVCVLLAPLAEIGAQPTPAGTGTVQGRVVEVSSGAPVAGAVASIPEIGRVARTDSAGRFRLTGLPAGVRRLQVSSIGFAPARADLALAAGESVTVDVELRRMIPMLDSVLTSADAELARNPAMREFDDRRRRGLGRFVTRATLLRNHGRSLEAVLRSHVPGLRIVDDQEAKVAASGRTSGRIRSARPCYLNVFVDGLLRYQAIPGAKPFDLRSLESSMIAGIEVYTPATIPAEFNVGSNTPCGALVIWLQQ